MDIDELIKSGETFRFTKTSPVLYRVKDGIVEFLMTSRVHKDNWMASGMYSDINILRIAMEVFQDTLCH